MRYIKQRNDGFLRKKPPALTAYGNSEYNIPLSFSCQIHSFYAYDIARFLLIK
jgi:hypothetical protein